MLHLLLLCDESFRFLGYYIDDISILKSLQTEKTQRFWVGDNWAASVLIGAVVDSGFRVAQATWGFQNPLPKKQNCFQWNNHAESLDSDGELLPTLCRRIVSWLGDVSKPWFPGFHLKIAGMSMVISSQTRHRYVTWELQLLSQATRIVVDGPGTVLTMGARARCRQRANSPGKAGKAGGAGWKNGILDVSWNKHQI